MLLDTNAAVAAPEVLQAAAAQVMRIDDTTLGDGKEFVVRFRGELTMESQVAFALISDKFRALGCTALFRKEGETHVLLALRGTLNPTPSRTWINYLMLGLTAVSVLFTGGVYGWAGRVPTSLADWVTVTLSGWPFLLSLLGILLAHELGHYIAARIHRVAVTLPYFIPLPYPISAFGTMGAFIQLKAPPTNKRVLLDIGLAGPLAGFVVAVPILIYGLITSGPLRQLPVDQVAGFEGNSFLYVFLKYAVFGKLLPQPASFAGLPPLLYMLRFYVLGIFTPGGGQDVFLNQVAWAGWAGLLVTGLNLIPAGQLDGGHALYVLVGRRAQRLLPVILAVLIVLGIFWPGWWLWAVLIYTLGRTHAEPLDQITELDPARRALAIGALVLFVLIFTPVPLK